MFSKVYQQLWSQHRFLLLQRWVAKQKAVWFQQVQQLKGTQVQELQVLRKRQPQVI